MHLLATERKVKCCLCPVCSQLTFIHNEDLKGGTILSHVWLAPSTWWKFYKNHEMLFHISLMYCKSSVNNLGMRHFPFCPFKVQESTALEGGKNIRGRENFSLHWNVDRQMFLLVGSTTRDTQQVHSLCTYWKSNSLQFFQLSPFAWISTSPNLSN